MSLFVVLCFAVGTAVEMYLLGWLSGVISTINTFSFSMFTFLIGIVVGRSWGREFFDKMQWHLKSRTIPNDEVLNGAVMALASMMLITPGIVTDTVGFLILFPKTRWIFKKLATNYVQKRINTGEQYYFFKN